MHFSTLLLPLATLACAAPASELVSRAPSCTTFKVPINASAETQVFNIPDSYNFSQGLQPIINAAMGDVETELGDILGPISLTSGTYKINMKYCVPEVTVDSRAKTVQFLVHPATMTMAYWDFPVRPETYSWVNYFSKIGYPTLSIDRLGAGESDRPDPINIVQASLQTNINHVIVQMLRSGTVPNTGDIKFEKVIFVGGSYGSILGNVQALQYPDDVDSYILTAYTSNYTLLVPIFSLQSLAAPAALVDPSNFADLALGYLTNTDGEGRKYLYSAPEDYDQDVFDHDEENRGTITIGEALTATAGNVIATNFTGSVKIITGQEDKVFCGTGVDNATGIVGAGDCGSGNSSIPAQAASYFPNANFSYSLIPETGHVTVLHKSVQKTFEAAAEFLEDQGF